MKLDLKGLYETIDKEIWFVSDLTDNVHTIQVFKDKVHIGLNLIGEEELGTLLFKKVYEIKKVDVLEAWMIKLTETGDKK